MMSIFNSYQEGPGWDGTKAIVPGWPWNTLKWASLFSLSFISLQPRERNNAGLLPKGYLLRPNPPPDYFLWDREALMCPDILRSSKCYTMFSVFQECSHLLFLLFPKRNCLLRRVYYRFSRQHTWIWSPSSYGWVLISLKVKSLSGYFNLHEKKDLCVLSLLNNTTTGKKSEKNEV